MYYSSEKSRLSYEEYLSIGAYKEYLSIGAFLCGGTGSSYFFRQAPYILFLKVKVNRYLLFNKSITKSGFLTVDIIASVGECSKFP